MKQLSKNAMQLPESGTIKILDLAKTLEREGKKVIHLDVGEPQFDTPEEIKQEAVRSIIDGNTKYTSSRGIFELREAIIRNYNQQYNLDLSPAKNIIITPGAKFAVYAAILSIISKEDHVALLTPSWVTYWAPITFISGKAIDVNVMLNEDDFEEKLKSSINRKTKLLIYNSPNNPTGKVLTKKELKLIHDLSVDYDFFVLADEIYGFLTYNQKFYSILEMSDIFDRLIIINGFSKKYAMTGWRIGYAIGPENLINAMVKFQQAATTCPTSFVQYGTLAVFKYNDILSSKITKMKEIFKKNRDLVIDELSKIPNIRFKVPDGAFYIFPDISMIEKNSYDFVMKLLKAKYVSITPGVFFGDGGEGHVRISFATSKENIIEGINRIKEFIKELYS